MAYIDNVNKVLNIQPEAAPTRVRLSQNENGRNLYFTLAGNENPIPSGVTVTISGTKPDGTVYSGTGSISNDVVLIPETVQLTAVAGVWDAKVKITSGGNTVATGRIRFLIDADTVAPGSVPSSSVLEGLVEQAQQYAETARQEAYGSPLTAALASDMTDKTRVYVYTGSESGYTAGHWYYWNGSAWSDGGVYNSTAVQTDKTLSLMDVPADGKAVGDAIATDKTLSIADAPADAKVVGDELTSLKGDLSELGEDVEAIIPGLSDEAKEALLACFANVAWTNQNGRTYYDNLKEALGLSLLYSWDFTKSLTDTMQGLTVTLTGRVTLPTQNNTGIIFDAFGQAVELLGEEFTYKDFLKGKTVQIDVAEFDSQSTITARTLRFLVMADPTASTDIDYKTGLCYYEDASTNDPRWCLVTYVEGQSISYVPDEVSFMSTKEDISGHTIGMYFDVSGRIKVYRDGILKGISNNSIIEAGQFGLRIGSVAAEKYGGRFYNARITGARIYDGDIA